MCSKCGSDKVIVKETKGSITITCRDCGHVTIEKK